jgi:2'-5' RNA ligase
MRLFFALWPEDEIAHRFSGAAAELSLQSPARLVNVQSFHITLAFVGEVAASNLLALRKIGAAQRASCCSITFDGLAYWPDPQVVASTALEFPNTLRDLSARLQEATALHHPKAASPAPLRTAHVTLARKVLQAPVLPVMSPFTWHVNRFSLVSSDTSGVQSIYTVLDTWPLLYES